MITRACHATNAGKTIPDCSVQMQYQTCQVLGSGVSSTQPTISPRLTLAKVNYQFQTSHCSKEIEAGHRRNDAGLLICHGSRVRVYYTAVARIRLASPKTCLAIKSAQFLEVNQFYIRPSGENYNSPCPRMVCSHNRPIRLR